MSSEKRNYEYDVAFSFLHEDENLAFKINDLISDKYSTFIYSKKQDKLVGTDGELFFNEAFGKKARIVIVLFRGDWGTTKWTRIEENAIKNRGYEEGYDFVTFIQLDNKSSMPNWLPKSRIYLDYSRWGIDSIGPIIDSRIQEAGGHTRAENIEDKAEKLKRTLKNERERAEYLSGRGYREAKEEFTILCELIENSAKSIQDDETNIKLIFENNDNDRFVINYIDLIFIIAWEYSYNNSLEDSKLIMGIAKESDRYTANIEQHFCGRPKVMSL
jgi:hypothetical protein